MNDAQRDQDTSTREAAGRPWAARTAVTLAVALYFLQVTVLTPADMAAALGFSTTDLGHRWWTVGTFTFVHPGAWTLLVNGGIILVFGSRLERVWGSGEFIRYYAVCALGAWIAHLMTAPPAVVLAGAGAPAIGIILAFAALSGSEPPLRIGAVSVSAGWLAVAGTVAVLATGLAAGPAGPAGVADAPAAYLVHAAGLVAGWAYLRTAGSISLARLRDGVSPVPDEPEDVPPRAIPRSQPRAQQRQEDDIVARSNAAVAREAAVRREVAPPPRDPAMLNRVLDKISAHGLDSLTADERRLLDEMSRRLRSD